MASPASGSSWTRRGLLVGIGLLGALTGCGDVGPEPTPSGEGPGGSGEPPQAGLAASAATETGRFGFGQPVTAAEVQRWDIDIGPDGAGLPPGSGTVSAGAEVYERDCVACHGVDGQGGPNDVLVGAEPRGTFPFGSRQGLTSTIGNYWPYATTVFDYVRRAMPFDRPGSLSDDEVYAVTAWLLWRNDLISEDAVMDASSLPQVVMPAKEFFVPSEEVRLGDLP